jgi:L-fuconolactonase
MIIDTHTHFYDPTRPQGVPWPPADDAVLYRRVMPEDYKALAVPRGVTGTIVVEASTWVEDNQWILDLAAADPFIVGFVGNLQPGTEDFGRNLERFAANPLFRGIRPRGVTHGMVGLDAATEDLEQLAARDLSLDLLVGTPGLAVVPTLAERLPRLRMIVNHVALVPIDGRPPDAAWIEGIRRAAGCPNAYCKVSGLVETTAAKPAPSDLEYYRPTLDALWDAFGADRLVYGSNWPVSERFADYATVIDIVAEYFSAKGAEVAEKYFWRNAKAAYRW